LALVVEGEATGRLPGAGHCPAILGQASPDTLAPPTAGWFVIALETALIVRCGLVRRQTAWQDFADQDSRTLRSSTPTGRARLVSNPTPWSIDWFPFHFVLLPLVFLSIQVLIVALVLILQHGYN
jgi:hypothetical protein